MKKIFTIILFNTFAFIYANLSFAITLEKFNGSIYVKECTVSELEELLKKERYQRWRALPNNEFPSIFLQHFPKDFNEINSAKYRNELFIRILTPIALKINEELYNERSQLLLIKNKYNEKKELSDKDIAILESLALKYDYFTRTKDNERIETQLKNLELRINVVPPSVLVAIAAMETNWGTSRLVAEANSLYKEKVWNTDEGLEPLENKEDGYRFKIFKNITHSMRHFANKFNSNITFYTVWTARQLFAEESSIASGESIAYTLAHASNLPNYVGILDYTTAFYDLYSIDMGKLRKTQ